MLTTKTNIFFPLKSNIWGHTFQIQIPPAIIYFFSFGEVLDHENSLISAKNPSSVLNQPSMVPLKSL